MFGGVCPSHVYNGQEDKCQHKKSLLSHPLPVLVNASEATAAASQKQRNASHAIDASVAASPTIEHESAGRQDGHQGKTNDVGVSGRTTMSKTGNSIADPIPIPTGSSSNSSPTTSSASSNREPVTPIIQERPRGPTGLKRPSATKKMSPQEYKRMRITRPMPSTNPGLVAQTGPTDPRAYLHTGYGAHPGVSGVTQEDAPHRPAAVASDPVLTPSYDTWGILQLSEHLINNSRTG